MLIGTARKGEVELLLALFIFTVTEGKKSKSWDKGKREEEKKFQPASQAIGPDWLLKKKENYGSSPFVYRGDN